jgi:hypothetical protein
VRIRLKRPRAVIAAGALAVIAAGGLFLANAGAAVLPPSQNLTGEAGYYVQHWNNWHIRDAHAVFAITPAMEDLNQTLVTSTYPGAIGVELCDPDNGYSAQLGLTFIGGQFELLAAHGSLDTSSTGQDPCVQNGVIVTGDSNTEAAVQLAGATTFAAGGDVGGKIWATTPADPENIGTEPTDPTTWALPVNRSQPTAEQVKLAVGDVVTLDLYYNPVTSHGYNSLQFTTDVYSSSGVFLGEDQYTDGRVRPQNFFEAAIGAANNNAPALTAPAVLPLVDFTTATFTNYNKSAVDKLNGGWGLTQAQTINGASQVTMTPTTAVGNSFADLEGSASS